MPDRITDLLPRPTRVSLAGESFPVGELRLCDIADLQSWLDARFDPLAGVRPWLFASSVPPEHRHLFDEAGELVDRGPVVWGDARASAALATGEGVVMLLSVALRRYEPGMSDARVLDIAERMTADEWIAVRMAVHRPDAAEVYGRTLDRLAGVVSASTPPSPYRWGMMVDRVARERGMTYEQVGELTLSQLVNMLRNGDVPDSGLGRPFAPGEDIAATARKRAAWLAGEDETDG